MHSSTGISSLVDLRPWDAPVPRADSRTAPRRAATSGERTAEVVDHPVDAPDGIALERQDSAEPHGRGCYRAVGHHARLTFNTGATFDRKCSSAVPRDARAGAFRNRTSGFGHFA